MFRLCDMAGNKIGTGFQKIGQAKLSIRNNPLISERYVGIKNEDTGEFTYLQGGEWVTEKRPPYVMLSQSSLDSLYRDANKLSKLEAYGVDNWSGYGDAMCDSEGIFEDDDNE